MVSGSLADYDGSGRTGILWRKSTTQQINIWLINGAALIRSGTPVSSPLPGAAMLLDQVPCEILYAMK
ncbi:MAG: hypothetical protein WCC27_18235 [Acidobacteriaceae bacterium]